MSYAHVIIDANKDWKETLVLVEFGKPTSQGQEHHCQSLRSSTDLHSPKTYQVAVHTVIFHHPSLGSDKMRHFRIRALFQQSSPVFFI